MATKPEGEKGKEEVRRTKASRLLTIFSPYLLFFVLSFLYLGLVVEPPLIYYCFGTILPGAPLFATGWPFLRESLNVPGGLVAYLSGFLSLGYYYAWLGAGIITLAGLGLAELFRRHLRLAGLARATTLAPLPAIAFFLIYSQYKHPLPACLAIALGLLLSLAFERLPLRRVPTRVAAFCVLAPLGFWLGGGGTLLLLALLTVIHGIPVRRDWAIVVLALPASVMIPWVLAQYVFLISFRRALLTLTPFVSSTTAGLNTFLMVLLFFLYGIVPLTVLLVVVGKIVLGGRRHKPPAPARRATRKERHGVAPRKRPSPAILTKPVLALLPVVLLALGLSFSHNGPRKPYVLSNYYSCRKQWDKIVELSHRLPRGKGNEFVSHDILRALYHTGRLPYDMFRCPLIPEAILLTHEKGQSDLTQWKLSDIFLELGHVNMAQKLASELVSTHGPLSPALDELGWIGIIKGQPNTARVYLNALKKNPVHRAEALSLLHGLDNGFTPEQASYIDRIRACMRGENAGVTGEEPVDETLAALVKHNPRNKMAFEYLMACYLLTGQLDKIVGNMNRLGTLGYQKIPTLYEEAILIYYGSREQEVDLARFNISPETLRRYEAFVQAGNTMQSQNRQAALNHLIREFGTSYFFYYTFGQVGLM